MNRLRHAIVAELLRNLREGGVPRIPEGGDILWRAFIDLSKVRSYHAAGPNPISYLEIEAWCRLTRWPLLPHHVEIVTAMDAAFIEFFFHSRVQTLADAKTIPQRSNHAVSPLLFDTIFA